MKKIIGITVAATLSFLFPDVARGTNEIDRQFVSNSIRCHHPPREPQGLLICGFKIYDDNVTYTYRIYCPNRTVRNITNGSWDKARTVREEDDFYPEAQGAITIVVNQVCY